MAVAAARTPCSDQLPAAALFIIVWLHLAGSWIVPQPKENVWVTLAKSIGQEQLCMAMGGVGNPLSTCLVGVPLSENDFPFTVMKPNPADSLGSWIRTLLQAPQEPQELDLLGSTRAHLCIRFYTKAPQGKIEYNIKEVTPTDKKYINEWCNYTSPILIKSYPYPKELPRGVFLICGDRVWAGIPSKIKGGPCSLGRLTTLTPNKTQIIDWKRGSQSARQKRSYGEFDPNCDSEIYDWGKGKRVAASIFLPWYAAAKALGEISHLGCWMSKQANATSAALPDLLAEEETTRHATLQNRAAIDFLLLAHGHSCEDFEGMCCFNLSSKSTSIQASIQRIQALVKDLKTETGAVDAVNKIFSQWGVPGWAIPIVKGLVWVLIIIFLISVALTIFKKLLTRTMGNVFLINQKGGVVGGVPALPWEATSI
ncbi:uncharacterized protein LOC128806950 [Vidua macroura]|uniref:uncharacterized protein LOC128806950 n=1 Tax=Vidua macroura TaxID=187451 RepID=UPI0023A8A831|nr:uncharacterized protein LOC128806950 [Vidua macroura]